MGGLSDSGVSGALHIVLIEPEIPQNAGNIARTCACCGADLHLIEPMGFRLSERNLRRAGMDYISQVRINRYPDVEEFLRQHANCQMLFFTGNTPKSFFDQPLDPGQDIYLVFGRESRGIDPAILERFSDRCVRIPMAGEARSLNLSNAVAIAAYETLRQRDFPGLH